MNSVLLAEMSVPHFVGVLTSACCCFFSMLIAVFVAIQLFVNKGSQKSAQSTESPRVPLVPSAPQMFSGTSRVAEYGDIITSVTPEGFYVYNDYLTPGSVIFFRYRQKGRWIERNVTYQPGVQGQFIFLGCAPQELLVTDIVPYGALGAGVPLDRTAPADNIDIPPQAISDAIASVDGIPVDPSASMAIEGLSSAFAPDQTVSGGENVPLFTPETGNSVDLPDSVPQSPPSYDAPQSPPSYDAPQSEPSDLSSGQVGSDNAAY